MKSNFISFHFYYKWDNLSHSVLDLKYNFQLRETRAIQRSVWFQVWGRIYTRQVWNILWHKTRNPSTINKCVKGDRNQNQKVLLAKDGTIWASKKGKECSCLKYIKCIKAQEFLMMFQRRETKMNKNTKHKTIHWTPLQVTSAQIPYSKIIN